MKVAVLAALAVMALPASAEPKFDFSDPSNRHAVEATALATLHVMDWLQTRQIAKNPDKYYERNGLLGPHPSVGKVNNFFLANTVAAVAAYNLVPMTDSEKDIALSLMILVKGAFVANNSLVVGISARY